MTRAAALMVLVMLAVPPQALGDEFNPVVHPPADAAAGTRNAGGVQRLLVRLRPTAGATQTQSTRDAMTALAGRAGLRVRATRRLTESLSALEVEPLVPGESQALQLARVRADSAVLFAEPDARRYLHALPNDPLYTGQWYLQNRVDAPSAIHAEAAWDLSTGTAGVVVAVIDTGVLFDHPDLQHAASGGRVLPGYDFITDAASANDGDGRDADASDAGDWITQAEANAGQFAGCDPTSSSWHGTRVAGIIGARTNSAEGIAGATWAPWILPVRALGKCGGFDSDILAAMLWAGGIHIDGVPDNPYPAKIENLSLGSVNLCPFSYQTVIAELSARGVLVVVSAGNEGGPVASPANCPGVVGVAGLRHAGTKVGFSSLGPEIAVGAPGGNCVNVGGGPCLFSIDTTSNSGTTTPGAHIYTNQLTVNVGTSFTSPIVSGVAALMASVNGNLGAEQLRARLREGATTPFPVSTDPTIPTCHVPAGPGDIQNTECNCTTSTCGAGMANALGALEAALRPIAAVAVPTSVSAGQSVALNGSGSAGSCNRTIASYAWAVVGSTGAVTNPNGPTTSVIAPATGQLIVRLTVTDDVGRTDSADVVVGSSSATTAAPATAGGNACPAVVAPPPAVTVTILPASASVQVSTAQTFTAIVANTQNMSVTWQIDGIVGGNVTSGTISSAGVYTAPASVPTPATVAVTAISAQDPAASGSAQITITPAPAPPPVPPASSGGGGGGGGALDWLALLALVASAALRGRGFIPRCRVPARHRAASRSARRPAN